MTPLFHAQPAWKDLLGNLKASEYQCVLPVAIVHSAVVQEFPLTPQSFTHCCHYCRLLGSVQGRSVTGADRTELLESVPVMCLSKHHLVVLARLREHANLTTQKCHKKHHQDNGDERQPGQLLRQSSRNAKDQINRAGI